MSKHSIRKARTSASALPVCSAGRHLCRSDVVANHGGSAERVSARELDRATPLPARRGDLDGRRAPDQYSSITASRKRLGESTTGGTTPRRVHSVRTLSSIGVALVHRAVDQVSCDDDATEAHAKRTTARDHVAATVSTSRFSGRPTRRSARCRALQASRPSRASRLLVVLLSEASCICAATGRAWRTSPSKNLATTRRAAVPRGDGASTPEHLRVESRQGRAMRWW